MTLFASATCEIEFSAGVWTDVSAYVLAELSPVTIKMGRKTIYEDIGAGTLNLVLDNSDGRFTPENTGSPYTPNVVKMKRIRFKLTKSATTYTRFFGWIQSWTVSFPSASVASAVTYVSAADGLSLLQQRKLRSNWTEIALWRARNDGCTIDAWEWSGDVNGTVAYPTNYSTDAGATGPQQNYNSSQPTVSFADDPTLSCGRTAAIAPDSNTNSCSTSGKFQSGIKNLQFMMKTPSAVVGAGLWNVGTFWNGGSEICNLMIVPNGTVNDLHLYNGNASTDFGVVNGLPFGQWIMVQMTQNGTNANHLDIWMCVLSENAGVLLSAIGDLNVDIRNLNRAEFPGDRIGGSKFTDVSYAGLIGYGSRTAIAPRDAIAAGANGYTLDSRNTSVTNAASNLGLSYLQVNNNKTGDIYVGVWSDKGALDVFQEQMRCDGGMVWARGRDSTICYYYSDFSRPQQPIITIDANADMLGNLQLSNSVDTVPTRVRISTPGGGYLVVDKTAEAAGEYRELSVVSLGVQQAQNLAMGYRLLARSSGLKIDKIRLDLAGPVTDYTSTLFDESSGMGNLWPGQRIRLSNLPPTHFSSTTKDGFVEGWTENYGPDTAWIEFDTSPAYYATEDFTGTNGAAWGHLITWTAATTGTGGTATIQGNKGRISAGTSANVKTAKAVSGLSLANVEFSGKVTFNQSQGSASVWWRADSTLTQSGYSLWMDTTGTLRFRRWSGGSSTDVATFSFTISSGTQYGWRIRSDGVFHKFRIWSTAGAEPGSWNNETTDVSTSAILAPGAGGVRGDQDGTGTPRTFDWDDLIFADAQ